ncbi:HNH endonuclease [Streptomyces sp. NPDC059582]|uniref:HNH endonuclease n=1 Tax=Streptomyces sp. NPDC059582 TaxID=3346875 RepID=UPI003695E4C6
MCKKCALEDAKRPEKRQYQKDWKSKRRRELGVPERRRGSAEFCPQGHRKADNLRPGRYDCATCHRDRQLARNRKEGAQPRRKFGESWSCNHDPETSARVVKGKLVGCKHCHRERERKRPFNYDAWRRYYDANKESLRAYGRAWRAVNRPTQESWKTLGPAQEYTDIIKNDPCVYCGGPSSAIDHIVAVTRGGSGCPQNLAPICTSCNSSKQTKDVLNFLLYRLDKAGLAA